MKPTHLLPTVLALMPVASALAQQCTVPATVDTAGVPTKQLAPLGATLPQGNALQRITGAGADLQAQSQFHGFETGVAHQNDRIFVYFTPTDHRVVLGGTVIPVAYATLHDLAGKRATDLSAVAGIRGMFLKNGQKFQVVYATPDGQAAIAGVMWDAAGKDVTRRQIAKIPGAVPTIQVDAQQGGPALKASLAGLHGGDIGNPNAPEAVMFIDPQCMYSIRAIQNLMPSVTAGRVRLKIVPLSLLDYEDRGASTTNARAMLSLPENKRAQTWIDGHLDRVSVGNTATADQQLAQNMAFARSVQLKGTPTFLWSRHDGSVGRYEGNPRDIEGLLGQVAR